MSKYLIDGGKRLNGEVRVQRAKNSALTLIAASVLIRGAVKIVGCPLINDVFVMVKILERIGARCEFLSDGLIVDCSHIYTTKLPDKLTGEVRASFFITGALLSRFKTASLIRPGGCNIGARPIDIHLEGFKALGAECGESDCRLNFYAEKLSGASFRLKYPSVGATENLIMAATLADGVTVLDNCAREPEIKDLQDFLNMCGAKITGAGTRR
ncbi:MAG: UDP-N-acetylglucosamine 1-carboxyvinyltransferase, partial [Clostridia bacterium]|nr:UDP-N-acetylglucosamine 1-carboxyvinyltransferase [Clostridia bacterium]